MEIIITKDAREAGSMAGQAAAQAILEAIDKNGEATIILATGTSQFETLRHLVAAEGIDWSKVVMFHLDEYIGLPADHPASFRHYLQQRFIDKVPRLKAVNFINGEADPVRECKRLNEIINRHKVDVALTGIGENGHLAFNDPPADFETTQPFIVVNLDEACRKQQLDEGWFPSMEEVPRQAISMSIKQIMKSNQIICSVPDQRKASAVKNCVQGPVSNLHPSSILQLHPACSLYLDEVSASLLSLKSL